MTIPQVVLHAFAHAIWAKVGLVREGGLTERERRRILESIADDIKKCTDFTVPRVV